jgi:hypothetical protein
MKTIDSDALVTATGGLSIPPSTGPTFPGPTFPSPTFPNPIPLPWPQPSPTFPRPQPLPSPDPIQFARRSGQ